MVNFSLRQRRHIFMFCCWQVLVLVSPRWLWERCLCLLVVIFTRIRRYWMRSSCIWKKDYGCGFFVLWCPPLYRCNVWRSCLFLPWLCIWCFYTGIYLVGRIFFWPYNCIGWRSVVDCWWMLFFVVFFYYLCHVVCATVANLDVVFIKDFGLGAIIGEVFWD